MDSRTITREISSDDLKAALEIYYRSMRVIQPYEEISEATLSKGPYYITFVVKDNNEQGVESISF
jgi:hypothetical protein